MNKTVETPKWWVYLASSLLISSISIVIISIYCWWVISDPKELDALIAGFYLGFALYASYGIILLAIIGVTTGLFYHYSLKLYIITISVSLLPTAFFIMADFL